MMRNFVIGNFCRWSRALPRSSKRGPKQAYLSISSKVRHQEQTLTTSSGCSLVFITFSGGVCYRWSGCHSLTQASFIHIGYTCYLLVAAAETLRYLVGTTLVLCHGSIHPQAGLFIGSVTYLFAIDLSRRQLLRSLQLLCS